MGIGKILKLVGLYKVNEEYMKPVDEKLEAIQGGLGSVANVADSGSQIVDALKAGDQAKAVEVALEFCKIDDEVKELKEIQAKVKGGESIEKAVAAADGPALTKELVESTIREIKDHCEKLKELIPSIAEVGKEAVDKATNLPTAAASWPLAEKIGTPEAVSNTGKKATAIKEGADEAQTKLEALMKSLEQLKS
ncbi:MAG: hypothetical protein ACYSU0_08640 [Planctomycetota bacterium]|jgi:hypothetical protein